MEELRLIQHKLRAPKGRRNTFGNYNYRSCEDILEAVKPLLAEHECTLTISDEIVEVGGRIYVKAIATIVNKAKDDFKTVTAYAREAEFKKGMDDSQITGTASSYARKYALNGLFLIDDTKDADTDEYTERTKDKPITKSQIKTLTQMIKTFELDPKTILNNYGRDTFEDFTESEYANCLKRLEATKKKQEGNE